MKTMLFLLLGGITLSPSFGWKQYPIEKTATEVPVTVIDTISFALQIEPILRSRCNPCHFPNGKMYERMPFDQPKYILEFRETALKRFADEKEKKLMREFFQAN